MASPTAGKQEAALVLGSSIVAGFGADLYGVPQIDYTRWTSQFKPSPPGAPQLVTFTGATGRVNLIGHGWPAGTPLRFAGGAPPPEIPLGVPLYVANPEADSFQLYTQYLPALSGAHIPTFTGDGIGPTTVEPTAASNRPYDFKMPGVRMWTPRRPWCNNTSRLVEVATLANAVRHQGDLLDPAPVDQWTFVRRGVGRGNLRRVVLYSGAPLQQLLMAANFDTLPVNGDELIVLKDSHTIISLSADGRTVKVTDEGPPFTTDGGDVGRFCSFLDSPSFAETARKIVGNTDRELTFDHPLPAFPCASAPLGASPVTVTFNDATERVLHTAHGYTNGQAVLFAGGTTPGISQFTALYVTNAGPDDYQLALTRALALAGTNITWSGAASGTTTVKPLPTFDAATTPAVVTFDHTTERVLLTAHGFPNRRPFVFANAGGLLPGGVVLGAVYYTANVTADDFQFSATPGGAIIPFGDNGSGTSTVASTSRVFLPGHGIPAGAGGALTAVVFEGGTTPAEAPQRTVLYTYDGDATSFRLAGTWLLGFGGVTVSLSTSGGGVTTCKRTVPGLVVLRGANAVHDLNTMQPPNAILQDCTITLDEVAPCYLTGFDYTNWDVGTHFASPRVLSGQHTINAVPELAFHCKSRIDNPIVMLELGVSASMLSTFPVPGEATFGEIGPFHDITSLDWSPASPFGIHGYLVKALESLKALVTAEPGAPQLDIPVVFFNCTDNDHEPQRLLRIGANLTILRQEVNEYIAQLTGQTTPPDWIIAGPARYQGGPGSPGNTSVYDQLEVLRAANSTSVAIVDTRSYHDEPTLFAADGVHFSALGEIRLARDWFDAWLSLDPENQTDAAGDSADDGGGSEDEGGAGGGDSISPPTVAQEDELQAAMYGNAGIKRYRTPSGLEVEMESAEDTALRIEQARQEESRRRGLRQTRVRFD